MNADEIVKNLREWDELYLAETCVDVPMGCERFCKDKDCIVVQAVYLIESLQAQLDAAIADMKEVLSEGGYGCDYCKHDGDREKCTKRCSPATQMNLWQWRGPHEAGEGERDG